MDVYSLGACVQLGLMDVKLYSRLMLLAQILKEPAFTQLRTREQLGYIVSAEMNLRWVHTMVGGLAFRVLSKTHAPEVGQLRLVLSQ